jgi:hypothetical protein
MTKEEGVLSFAQPALQLHNKAGIDTTALPACSYTSLAAWLS